MEAQNDCFLDTNNSCTRKTIFECSEDGKSTMQKRGMYQNQNPYKKYTDIPLFKACYPFFMGMKVFGLFHSKEYIRKGHKQQDPKDAYSFKDSVLPLRKRITPSSIYSFVVLIIMWLHLFCHFLAFCCLLNEAPAIIMAQFTTVGYSLLIAINGVACFRATHKYTNIPQFFLKWGQMHQDYAGKPR